MFRCFRSEPKSASMQFLSFIAILCINIILINQIDHARGADLDCVIQDDPNQTVRYIRECPQQCVHPVSGSCSLIAGCDIEDLKALCDPGTVPKLPDKPVFRYYAGRSNNHYARRQYYDY